MCYMLPVQNNGWCTVGVAIISGVSYTLNILEGADPANSNRYNQRVYHRSDLVIDLTSSKVRNFVYEKPKGKKMEVQPAPLNLQSGSYHICTKEDRAVCSPLQKCSVIKTFSLHFCPQLSPSSCYSGTVGLWCSCIYQSGPVITKAIKSKSWWWNQH